jgi:L-lactate dehydrogenase complex protein LldG
MGNVENICSIFREKARAVSAVVTDVATMQAAFEYAADLCRPKDPFSGPPSEAEIPPVQLQAPQSGQGQKIVAAPGMDSRLYAEFEQVCRAKGVTLVDSGLRGHLTGIDMGFTIADYGIAETGTLVLNCPGEELRLATMISEVHVAVLPMSKICESAYDLEPELTEMMKTSPDYTAFITGASRTADIERVLALGVHGPLELHILLMEEK